MIRNQRCQVISRSPYYLKSRIDVGYQNIFRPRENRKQFSSSVRFPSDGSSNLAARRFAIAPGLANREMFSRKHERQRARIDTQVAASTPQRGNEISEKLSAKVTEARGGGGGGGGGEGGGGDGQFSEAPVSQLLAARLESLGPK